MLLIKNVLLIRNIVLVKDMLLVGDILVIKKVPIANIKKYALNKNIDWYSACHGF